MKLLKTIAEIIVFVFAVLLPYIWLLNRVYCDMFGEFFCV
jgi:hypothetical protein